MRTSTGLAMFVLLCLATCCYCHSWTSAHAPAQKHNANKRLVRTTSGVELDTLVGAVQEGFQKKSSLQCKVMTNRPGLVSGDKSYERGHQDRSNYAERVTSFNRIDGKDSAYNKCCPSLLPSKSLCDKSNEKTAVEENSYLGWTIVCQMAIQINGQVEDRSFFWWDKNGAFSALDTKHFPLP